MPPSDYFDDLFKKIANGEIGPAIEKMRELLLKTNDNSSQKQIIILSGRFAIHEENKRKGLVNDDDKELNSIINSLVSLISTLSANQDENYLSQKLGIKKAKEVVQDHDIDAPTIDKKLDELSQIVAEGKSRQEAGRWFKYQSSDLVPLVIDQVKADSQYFNFLFQESEGHPDKYFHHLITYIFTTLINGNDVTPEEIEGYLNLRGVKTNWDHISLYRQLFTRMIEQVEGLLEDNNLPMTSLAKEQLLLYLKSFLDGFTSF